MHRAPYDYAERRGVRQVSWEDFHGISRALAVAASAFGPDIVLPVIRGGLYPGMLLAHMLRTEVFPIRLSRRTRDEVTDERPRWLVEPPAAVAGRRVLIVDEISDTGETLALAREKAEALGATAVRCAVLYAHPWGSAAADYIGLVTDALILNPWDREIVEGGAVRVHPEYEAALRRQGLPAGPETLIQAPLVTLAKSRST
jgi:hypoxanthine phosphoribosyltransferase